MKFAGTYADVKEHAAKFATYKQTTKRTWVTEKQDLATLLGNVQTKLKTYKLRPYVPPPGLSLSVSLSPATICRSKLTSLQDIDDAWEVLLASEVRRSRAINAQIRECAFRQISQPPVTQVLSRIQETLRKKFAALADGFHERLRAISLELSAVEGPLEEQQRQIEEIQTRITALSGVLEVVEAAEAECVAAKVEENDYTVFSCQDLEFELELVVQSIAKKISFIDNQACFHLPSGVRN